MPVWRPPDASDCSALHTTRHTAAADADDQSRPIRRMVGLTVAVGSPRCCSISVNL